MRVRGRAVAVVALAEIGAVVTEATGAVAAIHVVIGAVVTEATGAVLVAIIGAVLVAIIGAEIVGIVERRAPP